jgi:hypothetical protein
VRSPADLNKPEFLAIEMPALGGVGQVRSIAKAYGVFATGGHEPGITKATLDALITPAASPFLGIRDMVLHVDTSFGSRLPNLSVVAEDPKTAWIPIMVGNWYGEGERTVEVVSETALWYSTGLPAVPLRWVLIRDPKEEFETQALLCTDLDAKPERIISWFARRWQMETTFQEVRQRLGFETQRHWSELAVRRTAPVLLGLFSMVTLFAHRYMAKMKSANTVRRTAWYDKPHPTFSDALALVRKELWAREATFCESPAETDTVKVPRALVERLTDAVCHAA